MARTGVRYLDIAQAAEAIQNRDEEPTVDRVRAELGTGSKSTIAPLLKRWRAEAGGQEDSGGLPTDLVNALKALHQRVEQEAERKVDEARKNFETEADKRREETEQARATAAGLERQVRELEHRLETSEEENRKLGRELQESQAALAKSEFQREEGAARIAALKSDLEEQKQENRDMRDHFEHFQLRTADDRQQEREQFRETSEQFRRQIDGLSDQLSEAGRRLAECEALCEARQVAIAELDAEKQQLLQQVSSYRSEVDALTQKTAEQTDRLAGKATEIGTLRDKVSDLSGTNAAMSREAELLRQSLDKTESELTSAREEVATLVEENRTVLQEKAMILGQFKQLERSLVDE